MTYPTVVPVNIISSHASLAIVHQCEITIGNAIQQHVLFYCTFLVTNYRLHTYLFATNMTSLSLL
jgi:hypothetical protein